MWVQKRVEGNENFGDSGAWAHLLPKMEFKVVFFFIYGLHAVVTIPFKIKHSVSQLTYLVIK